MFGWRDTAVYMEMGDYEACLNECKKALERRYEVKADYEVVAKVCRSSLCITSNPAADVALRTHLPTKFIQRILAGVASSADISGAISLLRRLGHVYRPGHENLAFACDASGL